MKMKLYNTIEECNAALRPIIAEQSKPDCSKRRWNRLECRRISIMCNAYWIDTGNTANLAALAKQYETCKF